MSNKMGKFGVKFSKSRPDFELLDNWLVDERANSLVVSVANKIVMIIPTFVRWALCLMLFDTFYAQTSVVMIFYVFLVEIMSFWTNHWFFFFELLKTCDQLWCNQQIRWYLVIYRPWKKSVICWTIANTQPLTDSYPQLLSATLQLPLSYCSAVALIGDRRARNSAELQSDSEKPIILFALSLIGDKLSLRR